MHVAYACLPTVSIACICIASNSENFSSIIDLIIGPNFIPKLDVQSRQMDSAFRGSKAASWSALAGFWEWVAHGLCILVHEYKLGSESQC